MKTNSGKKEIKNNSDMLEILQSFCKENNFDIELFKVVKCGKVWKIVLSNY